MRQLEHKNDTEWSALAAYVTRPYAAERQQPLVSWLKTLEPQRDQLSLTKFVAVQTSATGVSVIDGYNLNQQMYISTSPAVLMLAHPQQVNATERPDQRVGIWLHDFGVWDDKFHNFLARELHPILNPPRPMTQLFVSPSFARTPRSNCAFSLDCLAAEPLRYLNEVDQTINARLAEFHRAGLAFTQPNSTMLRLAADEPASRHNHRDLFQNDKIETPVCGRVFIHAVQGAGTGYVLPSDSARSAGEAAFVACPVGATSSHLGFLMNDTKPGGALPSDTGVLHRAVGHPDGRVVLIKETAHAPCRPMNAASLWQIKHSH
jgi:hypothetical protein